MSGSLAFRMLQRWAPPILGVSAVVASCVYVVTRQSRVDTGIRELEILSATLDQSAGVLEGTVISPGKQKELHRKKAELQARSEDVRKPGLLQAELMQSARNANLEVREILPVAGQSGSTDEVYPTYRVSVAGTYRQIAEYVEACATQRLPARVRRFKINHVLSADGNLTGTLLGEITVEGFSWRELESEGAGNG